MQNEQFPLSGPDGLLSGPRSLPEPYGLLTGPFSQRSGPDGLLTGPRSMRNERRGARRTMSLDRLDRSLSTPNSQERRRGRRRPQAASPAWTDVPLTLPTKRSIEMEPPEAFHTPRQLDAQLAAVGGGVVRHEATDISSPPATGSHLASSGTRSALRIPVAKPPPTVDELRQTMAAAATQVRPIAMPAALQPP